MVKFVRKFENRGIKIARVNSIRMTKPFNYFNFALWLGTLWLKAIFRA